MKKVININFQGRVVPIEESAYDLLKQYTESLSKFFANEEGRDEIINDIEGRISELFAESLKKGNTCVTDNVMNTIISSIGKPEDFEVNELNVAEQINQSNTSNRNNYNASSSKGFSNFSASTREKMFRDENNKIIGGVCSGVANYFNADASIIRVLTAIFFGVTFLPYLILWVVIPSSATQQIGSFRKRLFRNTEENVIAGVCSGLSYYFGISVWIPRLLFLIPFLSFVFKTKYWFPFGSFPSFINFSISPGAIVIYVILWLILPEAVTAAEKLEMKGEKVDLNSIKNTIQSDLEGFGKRVNDWGDKINNPNKQTNDNSQNNYQSNSNMKKMGNGFAQVFSLIAKIIAYTILGIITVSILIALFALGISLTGLLPIKDFVIKDGWQNLCAWGTLLLFIWVPVIGAITFIIRRLTKSKKNSNVIRYSFSGLWTLGWVFAICFIASLTKDFRYGSTSEIENIALQNPTVQKLELKTSNFNKSYNWDWLDLGPFANINEDTAFVKNFRITVTKSVNDSFQIKVIRKARGVSKVEANNLANKIDFIVDQKDSTLKISKGIAINKVDKFRNQQVNIVLAVPIGKRFKITNDIFMGKSFKLDIDDEDDEWYNYKNDFDFDDYSFETNVEYVMTAKGIKRVNSEQDSYNENQNNENENEEEEKQRKLEQYKNSREELRLQIEKEKKELEEQKRKLEEKQKEFNKSIDSSNNQTSIKPLKVDSRRIESIFIDKFSA